MPPALGFNNEVTNHPIAIIDNKIFHMSKFMIQGLNMITPDFIGASQMRVAGRFDWTDGGRIKGAAPFAKGSGYVI